MPMKRPLISVAPFVLALWRRKSSSTCTTTIPVTLQFRSRMSHLAAHHADELVVLQGLADLHLRRHEIKAPPNPVARLRDCPSPLSACQASLFVGEIMVILRTSAEPGLQDFTSTSLVLQVLLLLLRELVGSRPGGPRCPWADRTPCRCDVQSETALHSL